MLNEVFLTGAGQITYLWEVSRAVSRGAGISITVIRAILKQFACKYIIRRLIINCLTICLIRDKEYLKSFLDVSTWNQ